MLLSWQAEMPDKGDKMTLSVNIILPITQTVVAKFLDSRSSRDLSYKKLFQYSPDEGNSEGI